jgi:hypothetical protein
MIDLKDNDRLPRSPSWWSWWNRFPFSLWLCPAERLLLIDEAALHSCFMHLGRVATLC